MPLMSNFKDFFFKCPASSVILFLRLMVIPKIISLVTGPRYLQLHEHDKYNEYIICTINFLHFTSSTIISSSFFFSPSEPCDVHCASVALGPTIENTQLIRDCYKMIIYF